MSTEDLHQVALTLHPEQDRTRVKLASSFKVKMGLPAFVLAWRVRQGPEAAPRRARHVAVALLPEVGVVGRQ